MRDSLRRWPLGSLPRSGPAVARTFHRLLASVFLAAWCSLGVQVKLLIGSRGLLPLAPYVAALKEDGASFGDFPSVLRWATSDGAILAGVGLGIALSLLALAGVKTRLCLGIGTALYLSYAVACRTFLGFQWDNLLIECGALATLLPADRPRPFAHTLFRILLFKLYFESGLAKWGSPLHDWQDGRAMTFYYETAPLPTRLAWTMHALPASWHYAESWFTLFFELVVPFAIFGPRRPRLAAAAVFTVFQIADGATANYGFFCWLSAMLNVFLLDDADIVRARSYVADRLGPARILRARAWLRWIRRRRLGGSLRHAFAIPIAPPQRRTIAVAGAAVIITGYVTLSLGEALVHFAGVSPPSEGALGRAWEVATELRVTNTYHLFAQITEERIEPIFETFDGTAWKERALRYKPGPTERPPPFVAPHQPRVDFLLWFYGLSFRRGTPEYVETLLDRMCGDRGEVEDLFASPLPIHPEGVRVAFYRYRFTSPAERDRTGAWWARERLGALPPIDCGLVTP